MMVALRRLRSYFLNGQFRAALNMLTEGLMREPKNIDQLHLYNVCLVYTYHKLKEFQSAKQMAQELLVKLERQTSLSLENDERIFPVKFLLACSLYEMKQPENLEILYQLLSEQKQKISTLRRSNGTARLKQTRPTAKESNNGQLQWSVWRNVEIEVHELFGAFPPQDDCCAKYIMLAHEICRIHTRQLDYRNSYKILSQCVRLFPKSAFVLSKAGRFCLETGRRGEANKFFDQV